MPDDGRLICCGVDPDSTALARRYWTASRRRERVRAKR